MSGVVKVLRIMNFTICEKHNAGLQDLCWSIPSLTPGFNPSLGICDERARKHGYVGRISRKSIERGGAPSNDRYTKTTKQEGLGDAFKKVGKAAEGAAKAIRGYHKTHVGQH